MSKQLVFDDAYIEDAKQYIYAAAIDADNKLEILDNTLKEACATGLKSGETADALKQFSERVASLRGVISQYGGYCSKLINEFFKEIEEVDGNLY